MTVLSISDFLKSKDTELTCVYGHLVNIFQIQNNLHPGRLIYCSFNDSLKGVSLSFRYDHEESKVHDAYFKSEKGQILGILNDEDVKLINKVLPTYFERVGVLVRKITKTIRSDWGREFKEQAIKRSGYTHYMSQEAEHIEKSCKLNIFSQTLESIEKKRAPAFPLR